jgi:hypothetical protein
MFAELKSSITFVSTKQSKTKITMNTFIPFIAQINHNAKTLNVLKSAGDKTFGNPEAAIAYLGGLPDDCQCISVGDYRNFRKQGYTITRSDLIYA